MFVEKAELRAIRDQKRHCLAIAKMIKDFWQNVDKVVDHRKQVSVQTL